MENWVGLGRVSLPGFFGVAALEPYFVSLPGSPVKPSLMGQLGTKEMGRWLLKTSSEKDLENVWNRGCSPWWREGNNTGRLRGQFGWLLFIVSHRWPQVPPKLSPSYQAMVTGELFFLVTSSPNDQGWGWGVGSCSSRHRRLQNKLVKNIKNQENTA